MSFDLSHLWQLVAWLQVRYLHWWYFLKTPFWSSRFLEFSKFDHSTSRLLLSRRNFVPFHLTPIQSLQNSVSSVSILWGLQYLDQLPTIKVVARLVGSNNLWVALLPMGKNTKTICSYNNNFAIYFEWAQIILHKCQLNVFKIIWMHWKLFKEFKI